MGGIAAEWVKGHETQMKTNGRPCCREIDEKKIDSDGEEKIDEEKIENESLELENRSHKKRKARIWRKKWCKLWIISSSSCLSLSTMILTWNYKGGSNGISTDCTCHTTKMIKTIRVLENIIKHLECQSERRQARLQVTPIQDDRVDDAVDVQQMKKSVDLVEKSVTDTA
ncbi:hypothetical protein LguiA_007377 [Lonicera macranthoides]